MGKLNAGNLQIGLSLIIRKYPFSKQFRYNTHMARLYFSPQIADNINRDRNPAGFQGCDSPIRS
jgi:hypothetical protein